MTSFLQKAIMYLSPRNAQKEGPIALSYQPEIFKAKKDQEKVFELTRELVNAQFLLGDDELSKKALGRSIQSQSWSRGNYQPDV